MAQPTNLQSAVWPASRLGEALEALARKSELVSSPAPAEAQLAQPPYLEEPHLSQWIEAGAAGLGIEAEAVTAAYPDVEQLIEKAGPALLRLSTERDSQKGQSQFLAVLSGNRQVISVLDPTLKTRRLPVSQVRAALCQPLEAPLAAEMDGLLDEVGVTHRRREQARKIILGERLGAAHVEAGWLLRPQPGHNLHWQIRQARLPKHLLAFLGTYALQYLIWIVSWWVIGRGALQGRLEFSWLLAWAMLLFSLIPFRLLSTWAQGQVAIRTGAILKRRLLAGALRLTPEEIRHQGAGQFLGQVIEAEAVETLALTGGLLGGVAALELVIAAIVIVAGAGGFLQMGLLLGWLGLTAWLGWRYYRQRKIWTQSRLFLTHDLLERMVGHRTRLAQENPEHWHNGEDEAMNTYLAHSRHMDQATVGLTALIPRGWLALGLLGLVPAFMSGDSSVAGLAIGLGGLLLAYQALHKLAPSLQYLAGAAIAWQQVEGLFEAAARPQLTGSPNFALKTQEQVVSPTLIEAHRLAFRYRPQGEPVLKNCHLQIQAGDRLLLEGPSGGGKSTLATLLTGLRRPETGLLLLQGLDRQTLGDTGWRQRVVAAPQFHENHVLTGTFAFNLLMGRQWPPRPKDVEAAETLCRDLGLGDLLERMPSGLLQMVGETGWQLSHGERSRLYLARALLQDTDLTILDESFAALDPENMQRALRCVLDQAKTLLVIAHP